MDSSNLYLDSDQVMPYMEKLEEINKYDPEHYDNVAYSFCLYVTQRKNEIVKNYHINRFLKKKNTDKYSDKYVISKAVMDYLSSITGLSYVKLDNANNKTFEKVNIKNKKTG